MGLRALAGTLLVKTDSSHLLSASNPPTSGACIPSYSGSGSIVLSPVSSGQTFRTLRCERSLNPTYSPQYGRIQASSVIPAKKTTATSLQSPIPTAAGTLKYKDSKLTGCYAGTGGSTTFTLTSGELLGIPTESAYKYVYIKDNPQSFNFSCSEFFKLGPLPWHLRLSFAESPACASYNQDLLAAQKSNLNMYADMPPGVVNGDAHVPFNCCGGCKLVAPEVQLLYWSTPSSGECSRANATITPQGSSHLSSPAQEPRAASPPNAAPFAVVDGSTLTFPSLYIAILGAVSVTDHCKTWGKAYHNPTVALPLGDLSTLSFHGNGIVFDGFAPKTGVFDPAACRTYGLSNGSTHSYQAYDYSVTPSTLSWVTTASYTMGPPYNPILLPPKQLTALDPEWQACTSWDAYGDNAYDLIFGLYDPPRVLTPTTAMVDPSPTPPNPAPQQATPAPQPASPIMPVVPVVTASPNAADPSHSKGDSPGPVKPDTGLAGFILRPFGPDPSKVLDVNGDPNANVNTITPNPIGDSPPTITIDRSPYTANEASQYTIDGQTPYPGGPIIYVHGTPYSLALPMTRGSTPIEMPAPPPIDGEVILQGPKGGILIAGQTVIQGGQATIYGTAISVGPSNLVIDGSTYALPSPTAKSPLGSAGSFPIDGSAARPILTIDRKANTADSASQHIVGSQTLVPGGSPIAVNGIPYAIASAVTAIISNSHTIALAPQITSNAQILSVPSAAGFGGDHLPQTYAIDGISLTGEATALAVGSTTLIPGSPPLTVSGHVLSLTTGGALIVDGSTNILASESQSSIAGEIMGISGSGNDSNVLAFTGDGNRAEQARLWLQMLGLLVLVWRLVL